ncbi:MAG: secretin N-terminal domain-containing protein [Candidatus Omnitrophota bacterium]
MKRRCLIIILSILFSVSGYLCAEQTFSIDFNNVTLSNFIQAMSRLLNQNFALAPGVSGNVTIYSARPIPVKEAESVFYTVLHLYGFTAIPDNRANLIRIVPLAEAKVGNIEVGAGKDPEKLTALGEKFLTQIVPLTYSKPEALLPLINPFLSKNGNLSSDSKTNTLLITDVASNIRKILLVINELDKPAPPGQETLRIYQLLNANAQEVAQVLTAVAAQKSKPAKAGEVSVPISVVAAPATNSLLITAGPEDYASLENVIRELDRMPDQVLIEALVAEVSGDLIREFGVQWQYFEPEEGNYKGLGAVGGTVDATLMSEIESGIPPAGLLVGVAKGSSFDVGAILRLYGKNSNFKILSTPQIVTTDNKEAIIKVAETIPYSKQITYSTDSSTIPTQSFDYQDVGITLKITPHISEDRNVRLDIEQEVTKLVSYLSTSSSSATVLAPTIAKRSAKSSVIIADRATLALGGLIRNDSDETIEKVPGLGDIPILGYLFRHKTKTLTQTSLYIFITPTVITTKEEAATLTEEKKSLLKQTKPLSEK